MNEQWVSSVRRHVAVTAAAVGVGGAWGSLIALGAMQIFGMEEARAWIFVAAPIALLVALLVWKRLPKILGFEGS